MDIEEDRVIHFPQGLPGFPDQKQFALMEHKPGSPFMWLQSIDTPDLAFVVTDPFLIVHDYLQDAPDQDRGRVWEKNVDKPLLLTIVNIPQGEPRKMTVNLQGPLVIDVQARTGKQVILVHSGYSTRHPVLHE
ncbi:MAG: flagellar assembly protein FliW [Desulfobacteraceae bacterium]